MSLQNRSIIVHPGCFVCSPNNSNGLKVEFRVTSNGKVTGTFRGLPEHEGYPGILHGGIAAALLDGAMTNCLFAHRQEGLTVELNVRYRATVACGEECIVSAELHDTRHSVSCLSATLEQGGITKVVASAKFMPNPTADPKQQ